MNLKNSLGVALTVAATFSVVTPSFADTTTTFVAPIGFSGGSLNGFTFSSNWRANGNDTRNAPFMEWYDQAHSVTYDAGTFNFAGLSMGGWPWDNYGGGVNNVLTMVFKDSNGSTIEANQMTLALDNSFTPFTKTIAGVHEISFMPLGGTQPNGGWLNGSWPRLDSITMAAPVPEPETWALMLTGLGLLGFIARRRRKG